MSDAGRHLDYTRHRIAAAWALPVSVLKGDTEEEMVRSAAAVRPVQLLSLVAKHQIPLSVLLSGPADYSAA